MHGRHREILFLHLLSQPIHLSPCVAVYDRLGNGKGRVQVTKSLELPLLSIDGYKELLDTLQGQLVLLH